MAHCDDAVAETARLTEARPEFFEQDQRAINERLAYIAHHIHEHPEGKIRYFVPMSAKAVAILFYFRESQKISVAAGTIVTADGYKIPTICRAEKKRNICSKRLLKSILLRASEFAEGLTVFDLVPDSIGVRRKLRTTK